MRIGKFARALVAIAVAATAAYWYWSPHIAMRRMQDAAQRSDTEALRAHIDFPALRENMRTQAAAALGRKMGDPKNNPFAAFGTAIGTAFADQVLQVLVRTETIAASLRTGRWDPMGVDPVAKPGAEQKVFWVYERDGMNRVVVRPRPTGEPTDGSRPAFVLVRHGFADWKLAGITLPPLTHN